MSRHLDEAEADAQRVSEAVEQVALADTILLNKTDLVRLCVVTHGAKTCWTTCELCFTWCDPLGCWVC